jgi:hypothetical protein
MTEVRVCSPPILKTLMANPLGGDAGGSTAPTTYLQDIDGRTPWEAMMEVWGRPPPILKTSMAGLLLGDGRGPGVLTTYH